MENLSEDQVRSEQLVIVGYKLVRIKYHHLHVKLCSLSIEIVILS